MAWRQPPRQRINRAWLHDSSDNYLDARRGSGAVGGDANLEEADELYLVVIERFPASPVAEHARQARTRLAQRSMRGNVAGGLRPDVMM